MARVVRHEEVGGVPARERGDLLRDVVRERSGRVLVDEGDRDREAVSQGFPFNGLTPGNQIQSPGAMKKEPIETGPV